MISIFSIFLKCACSLKFILIKFPGIFYGYMQVYYNTLKADTKNIYELVEISFALYPLERYDEIINYYDEALIIDLNNKNVKMVYLFYG